MRRAVNLIEMFKNHAFYDGRVIDPLIFIILEKRDIIHLPSHGGCHMEELSIKICGC